MIRSSIGLTMVLSLVACSESNGGGSGGTGGGGALGGASSGGSGGSTTGGGGGSGGSSGSATGGAPSGGAGGSSGAGTGGAAGGGFEQCGLTVSSSSPIVVNEISASGDDWIELVNTDTAPYKIDGMVLADRDPGTGCPKTTEAITFPADAEIAAGEHLLIVADQAGAPNTLQTSCLGGPASCYHVGFGISGSEGDGIFLLDGTTLIAHGEIPASGAADGESWCRSPDVLGAFGKCTTPTPGAANP